MNTDYTVVGTGEELRYERREKVTEADLTTPRAKAARRHRVGLAIAAGPPAPTNGPVRPPAKPPKEVSPTPPARVPPSAEQSKKDFDAKKVASEEIRSINIDLLLPSEQKKMATEVAGRIAEKRDGQGSGDLRMICLCPADPGGGNI